jgi:putative aldouronate transport system permease protein
MRNFFRSIPVEIQESAKLDGASDFRIWARIIMPLSKPVLATVALWTAVGHWNAYFDALIYMNDRSKYVLQVILRRVLLEDELISMGMQPGPEYGVMMRRPTQETIKAALLMVTTLPIVFIYPFLQRYFIKGIMLGAVKG